MGKLTLIEQNKTLVDKNSSPQIAQIIEPKINKTIVENKRIEDLNIISKIRSTTKNKAICNLRGGAEDNFMKAFIKVVCWIIIINYKMGVEAFIYPAAGYMNHYHYGPAPRIAPKVLGNPAQANDMGQETKPSMDKFAKSLSPDYSEFLNKYWSDSLPERFNTKKYSTKEFKELATSPRLSKNSINRISIDEARTVTQAKLQSIIINPARPDNKLAQRVDLDFIVDGPEPFTHVDVKTPVSSEILKKQNQVVSIEEMAYNIGKNIVIQKYKFVGEKDGPDGPDNVAHLVDLCYLPSNEKSIVKQKILQGALDKGSDYGIIFLNDR